MSMRVLNVDGDFFQLKGILAVIPPTRLKLPPPPPLFKHLMMHIKGILICKLKYKYLELV